MPAAAFHATPFADLICRRRRDAFRYAVICRHDVYAMRQLRHAERRYLPPMFSPPLRHAPGVAAVDYAIR